MKGVMIAAQNAPWKAVDNIEKPVPGKHQILVKSLITGINPMDNLMRTTGLLIPSYPIVLGCDASGSSLRRVLKSQNSGLEMAFWVLRGLGPRGMERFRNFI
ncbi:hypothetical protein DID88_004614 [Monilinia fructigena]|uniref:Uncharacterized protein n=1 Tax=Monilinia fructigena TaxID=38457 RepID=A0A395IR60_9HELO|nr:hypothetical protein DID88_004614 [Monilinia fructigena]